MKINNFIKVNQGTKYFYSFSMTIEELLKNSEINYYKEENDFFSKTNIGYVQKISEVKLLKVLKEIYSLMKKEYKPLLKPIFCVINKNSFSENGNLLSFKEKMKVIEGLEYFEGFIDFEKKISSIKYDLLKNQVPVFLIPVESLEEEIELFIEMNSKNNNVSKAKEILKELKCSKKEFENFDELVETLSEDATNLLTNMAIWKGKIAPSFKTNNNSISFIVFKKSFKKIVKTVLLEKNVLLETINYRDKKYNSLVTTTIIIYNGVWEVIKGKWDKAFEDHINFYLTRSWGIDFVNDIICYYYKKDIGDLIEKILINNTDNNFWKHSGNLFNYSTEKDFERLKNLLLNNN